MKIAPSTKLGTSARSVPSEAMNASLEEVRRKFPRILLVDDSKFLADTLAMFFQRDGFSARAVYGGREALAAFHRVLPDIAFIDIAMPEMGGLEVARHVRSSGDRNRLVSEDLQPDDPGHREFLITGRVVDFLQSLEEKVSAFRRS